MKKNKIPKDEQKIIEEFDYVHEHKDELPDYKEIPEEPYERPLNIKPVTEEILAEYDKFRLQGVFSPNYNTIYLATTEEDTISSLWHEQMHKLLYEMFDLQTSKDADNVTFEIVDGKIKLIKSLMHDLQYWFFGEPKTSMNYIGQKKWKKDHPKIAEFI